MTRSKSVLQIPVFDKLQGAGFRGEAARQPDGLGYGVVRVQVVGFPTPVLTWLKDGRDLRPGDVYQLYGNQSIGVYTCVARNCMGEARLVCLKP